MESSTLPPAWVRELAGHAQAAGCGFLDAPVGGSRQAAASGEPPRSKPKTALAASFSLGYFARSTKMAEHQAKESRLPQGEIKIGETHSAEGIAPGRTRRIR